MPQVKHVVLMRFRPQTPREEIGDVYVALEDLQTKVPGLLDFSGGPYESPEGLNKGFTHAFIMTFEDAAARDAYLTHPDHELAKQKILALLDGGIEAALVFDYKVDDRFRY